MAATSTADVSKVDEVVANNSNVDEVVGEKLKSVVDEVVGEKISKMITLISSDGERFEMTQEAAAMSQTIQHMIEDGCVDNGVPLPNVGSRTLALVIEYCNKHVAGSSGGEQEEDLKSFDEKFIKVDQATLFDIVLAANYLDIKGLLDLSCQTAADLAKGKSVEELRTFFNIQNDFTKEEEDAIRKENPWAFD